MKLFRHALLSTVVETFVAKFREYEYIMVLFQLCVDKVSNGIRLTKLQYNQQICQKHAQAVVDKFAHNKGRQRRSVNNFPKTDGRDEFHCLSIIG